MDKQNIPINFIYQHTHHNDKYTNFEYEIDKIKKDKLISIERKSMKNSTHRIYRTTNNNFNNYSSKDINKN